MQKLIARIFVVALLLGGGSAMAQTTITGNLAVSVTVVAKCTVTSGALAFPNYDATVNGGGSDATGSITVRCTNGTPYSVKLGGGENYDTQSSTRQLATSGGDLLPYQLYSTAVGGTPWLVDGVVNGVATAGALGAGDSIPVFGRIATGLNPKQGVYADNVSITVTF